MGIFTAAKFTNLEISTSDHCPVFFEPLQASRGVFTKTFRFENAWLREPMCRHIVEEVWSSNHDRTMREKEKACSEILKVWGNEITGSFKARIKQCKSIMKSLRGRRDTLSIQKYQEATHKLNEIYTQEEIFWKQRCKQLWLSEGDQNSRFFHNAAKTRRKSNQINTLLDEGGTQ